VVIGGLLQPVSPEHGGPLWVDSVEKVSEKELWNLEFETIEPGQMDF
jgi:hypothetical protein